MKELLRVQNVRKYFPAGSHGSLKAVDDVSFSVSEGEVFGVVGESGCGKSTLAKAILHLIEPTGGEIFFDGINIFTASKRQISVIRRGMQIIFQDPLASLNPRKRVLKTIGEALTINGLAKRGEVRDRVIQLLAMVGLDADVFDRYPHEFSGGQRQRICIARALAVDPRIIIADEALSALDVSIQAQIMNLLDDLRSRSNLAYLFISHNLLVIEHFSDTVAVMYLGRIVEMAKTENLFRDPLHPYTIALLSAVPKPEIPKGERRIVLKGDVPSPLNVPPGCPFHPRCQRRFDPCDSLVPAYRETREGRWVACHLWN